MFNRRRYPDGRSFAQAIRTLTFVLLCAAAAFVGSAESPAADPKPNIVILFADDMGYGDLSCYGHPRIKTPNLDRLADEGMRLTSFVTGAWCVPSRTQLVTGRYMPRVKFHGSTGPDGEGGLPDAEWTLAEALKAAGYRTHMVGKWHLGHAKKKYLPVHQGFDTWLGLPYSNDFRKPWVQTDVPLGLYRGTEMIEHPLNQDTLTTRYTAEALRHIEAGGDTPFFLYLAYNMPHLPIHTAERFRGKSNAGLYGDVIETIDWSVGQVMETLKKRGLEKDTIVFFASDNGPWLDLPKRMRQEGNERWHAGSAGPLRGWKGTTYEGGTRVPAIFRWPGHISPHQDSAELVGMPDLYRTFVSLAGGKLPEHPLDGYDLTAFLTGREKRSPRQRYYYFAGNLRSLRDGDWKLHTSGGEIELFHMRTDPFERFNRADKHPDVVQRLREEMERFANEVGTAVAR